MASPQHSTNLAMPCFDELFDDAFSSFRIPPLRSMFPSSSSERLEALEPFTSFPQDETRPGLTGRQMALAQAKPMDVVKTSDLEALEPTITPAPDDPDVNHALDVHNRKKRKLAREEKVLEFVTLPKPQPKPKFEEANKKPFRPIAVLNQLNEPPPSAALFPPITPSQESSNSRDTGGSWSREHDNPPEGGFSASTEKTTKAKRIRIRSRQMWTAEETSDLLEGVAIMGVGRWKDILTHPKFHFQDSRTYVDLKDRFRVLFPQAQPEKWGDVGKQPDYNLKLRFKRHKQNKQLAGKNAPYRSWSKVEDEELLKGFQKHGYKWNLIAQDEALHFDDRSSTQIRDRFRRLQPQLYTDAPAPNTKANKSKRGRGRPPGTKKQSDAMSTSKEDKDSEARRDDGLHASEKDQAAANGGLTTPAFLSGLLNSDYHDETESEFSRSLADLNGRIDDNDGSEEEDEEEEDDEDDNNDNEDNDDDEDNDLTLPPVQWDEMAVQPIFDLG